MDDPVTGRNVRSDNLCTIHHEGSILGGDSNVIPLDSLDIGEVHQICCHEIPGNYMVQKDYPGSATVPLGSFLKAASVGANTVNGPGPLSVVVRFAACTAAAREVNLPSATAVSRIVFTTGAVVGTGVETSVGVGVTTGAGGWDVQPATKNPDKQDRENNK